MDIVLSFSALCILLVVGKLLRVEIRLFQKLYLPASVIGGLLGLVLVQTIGGSLPAATMAGVESAAGIPHQHRLLGPLSGSLHSTNQTHLGDRRAAVGVRPDCRLGPVRRRPRGGDRVADAGVWRPGGHRHHPSGRL